MDGWMPFVGIRKKLPKGFLFCHRMHSYSRITVKTGLHSAFLFYIGNILFPSPRDSRGISGVLVTLIPEQFPAPIEADVILQRHGRFI